MVPPCTVAGAPAGGRRRRAAAAPRRSVAAMVAAAAAAAAAAVLVAARPTGVAAAEQPLWRDGRNRYTFKPLWGLTDEFQSRWLDKNKWQDWNPHWYAWAARDGGGEGGAVGLGRGGGA